jgi:hypothetical protein
MWDVAGRQKPRKADRESLRWSWSHRPRIPKKRGRPSKQAVAAARAAVEGSFNQGEN